MLPFSVQVQFAYSVWWLIPILLAAGVLTWYFYPYQKNVEDKTALIFLHLKRVLRFLGLTLIMLLFLGPNIQIKKNHIQAPHLPVFFDISESIYTSDTNIILGLLNQVQALSKELEGSYEVKNYYFGDRIRDTFEGFTEKKTRLSDIASYLNQHYSRVHTGPTIVITDGIYNAGMSPLFNPIQLATPLFVIGTGDTSFQKDFSIADINHNSLVYLNNDFNIITQLHAKGYKGKTVQIRLRKDEQILSEQRLTLDSDNDFKTIELITKASKPGYNKYTIEISKLEGEVTYENNRRDFYVEVLDGREHIAIVYLSPHPDINALYGALKQNKNLEVSLYRYQDLETVNIDDFGLIVCHQLPGEQHPQSQKWIQKWQQNNQPLWVIIGSQTDINGLNQLFPHMRIQKRNPEWNDAQVHINTGFKPFSLSDSWIENAEKWPPLKTPFAQYYFSGFDLLANQKINQIPTQYPLIAYFVNEQKRQAMVLGEGIWKWRMADIRNHNNATYFNEWVWKTARYLMVKEDKRRFKVFSNQELYDENDPVEIIAEAYDQNFDPLPNAHLEVVIRSEDNKTTSYTMHARGKTYVAKPGILDPGSYHYTAQSTSHPSLGKQEGSFIVKPLNLEYQNLQANHTLLKTWAQNQNGTFYLPNEWQNMINELKSNEELKAGLIKPQIQKKWLKDLLLILLMISTLFTLEWLLRKWEGGY